jgi:hypothetical protein
MSTVWLVSASIVEFESPYPFLTSDRLEANIRDATLGSDISSIVSVKFAGAYVPLGGKIPGGVM